MKKNKKDKKGWFVNLLVNVFFYIYIIFKRTKAKLKKVFKAIAE